MSLRTRIVAVTVVVVVSSVVLTAVMVSLGVQRAAREEVARSLSNDAAIYQELLDYGAGHDSWSGVDALVQDLAERHDRRVALKTEAGRLLVDSDQLLGLSSGMLRAKPEAVVDPYDPQIDVLGSEFVTGGVVVAPELSDEDVAVNAQRVASATVCLDELAIPYQTSTALTGLVEVSVDVQLSDTQWEAASGCLDGLYVPLPSDVERVAAGQAVLLACLDAAGVEPGIAQDEFGDYAVIDADDPTEVGIYNACREQSVRAGMAPAVQLFLGSAGTTGLSVAGLATGSTLLIVLVIVAIAGAAVTLLTTRIVRPLRALTVAAATFGEGDLGARAVVTDRSEIGDFAETFNTMADSLARSEHARRRMISDIAHELRNPLVTLKGNLEAIQDGVFEPTPVMIASLQEETEHLRRMVSDLQELSTADAGHLRMEKEPVNMTALLETVRAAYAPLAASVSVSLRVDAPVPVWVEGDETRLRQVMSNLVGNAIAHTPPGGAVTLAAESQCEWANIRVEDTGEGIAENELPYVFERFWRSDPARSRTSGRTGLGLAITEALVRAHHGSTTVESVLGHGTTFSIALPRAGQSVVSADAAGDTSGL